MITLATLIVLNTTPVDWARFNKTEARISVMASNVALGCLRAGIGSAVNGGTFGKACLQGMVAGGITFLGKWVATYQEYHGMGTVGKLVHSLGASMTDNLMQGEDWLYSYSLDIGPVGLTFKRGSWTPDLSYGLTPLVFLGLAIVERYKFEVADSLYNLTPIFSAPAGQTQFDYGVSGGPVVIYERRYGTKDHTLSHEMVHTLQWGEFRACGGAISWGPWNVGQDLCHVAFSGPGQLSNNFYMHSPTEIEAYALER